MKTESKSKRKPEWPKQAKEGNASVTVYRRRRVDGNWGFEVADFSGGTRKLRSFPDADSALKEATRIARFMAAGASQAAQMRGTHASAYGRAVELLRPTGVALEISVCGSGRARWPWPNRR